MSKLPEGKSGRRNKTQELANLLRHRIATMHTGQRLPSVRGLMMRYRLSMQTVTAALSQLETEGLIMSRPGSGTYVGDGQGEKLIVLHRSYHPSYHEDYREHAIREAITRTGWRLVTRRHDAHPDIHPSLHPEPLAAAHLVSLDIGHLRPDLLDDLVAQHVPVVALEQTITGRPALDAVLQDDSQQEALMLGHFRALGHRQIGAVLNEPHFLDIEKKAEARVLKGFGLHLTLIDCRTKPGQSSADMAYRTMKRYLARHRGRLPFSAVCVTSSPGGVGVLRALHEGGVQVPRDCSVASFGSQTMNALLVPAITEVGIPYPAWGQAVVQLLEKRFAAQGRGPVSLRLQSAYSNASQRRPASSSANGEPEVTGFMMSVDAVATYACRRARQTRPGKGSRRTVPARFPSRSQ